VLRDALQLIVDEGVRTKPDLLAVEFTVPAGDIENLCGLPNGWFRQEAAEVVRLKTSSEGGSVVGDGEVIPFRRR
jgi:hypothetical protein